MYPIGTTCGLCGNLNDNQNDDFLTPQNLPETLATDFGDSWKVEPSCADTRVIEHPCKTNKHRAAWSYKTCNIIRRDVFKPCHEKVRDTSFFTKKRLKLRNVTKKLCRRQNA